MASIARDEHFQRLSWLLKQNPVVAILGARQIGKTTLAQQLGEGRATTRFDLENPEHIRRLDEPMLALEPLRGLVILDEIQRRPELFPVLRVLADRPRTPARFLVLGSASPSLLKQSSETLAGRIAFYTLPGFSLGEVGDAAAERLWLRGGFPRSFLARSSAESMKWRESFIHTFVERDLMPLGMDMASAAVERFWRMLAHYHGQIWNGSELARSFGISHTSVAKYLDILTGTFAVERMEPWFENASKRLVKSPKVFIADSGLFHSLIDVATPAQLLSHPKLGASWEGFVIAELRKHLAVERRHCFFWATHRGAELDLLVVKGQARLGFEIKRTSAPKVTPSMRIAMEDLGLDRLDVIHAGNDTFPLADGVRAVAFHEMRRVVTPLRWA